MRVGRRPGAPATDATSLRGLLHPQALVLTDLAGDPAYAAKLAEMEAALRDILDPEAVDAQAFADQAALIERLGGRDAALKLGAPGATPPPEAKR